MMAHYLLAQNRTESQRLKIFSTMGPGAREVNLYLLDTRVDLIYAMASACDLHPRPLLPTNLHIQMLHVQWPAWNTSSSRKAVRT